MLAGRSAFVAVLLGSFVGCAPQNVYLSQQYIASKRVAVLPVANQSTDLDGPEFVRKLLCEQLARQGFQLVPIADIDARLKEKGFTDGGQLGASTPQQLGEWTGADTLLYPVLEDFNYVNVGFYWQRQVRISARLVDARSGEKLWEAERDGTTRGAAVNREQAKREFATQLAVKAVQKATHKPLERESLIAVSKLLATLPYR